MDILEIKNRNEGSAAVVEFHGEIDASSVELVKSQVTPIVENDVSGKFIFDCTDLKFINSAGIGQFMAFHTKLAKKDKKLLLVGLQPQVKDVFDLIGLTQLLQTFPDVKSALF